MTTGFEQLGRELEAAERRIEAPGRPRARRPRLRASVLAPALGVIVALVVAGGAVVLIGGGGDRRSSTHAGESASSSGRGDTRSLSVAALERILGVLRRPRTPADRSAPLRRIISRSGFRVIPGDVRRATSTRTGQGVFLMPTRSRLATGRPGGALVILDVDGAFEPFSAADVRSGRASFSVSPDARPSGVGADAEETFVLVPDGVARVVLSSGTVADPTRVSGTVHGNVAILSAAPAADSPQRMRWYTAAGRRVPIHDYPDPVAHFPVNASGQTYGSDAGQPGGRVRVSGEPDLILASGQRVHGRGRVTGYVKRTQLDAASCGNVTSPAAAVACTRRTAGKARRIPLYARNGRTIVGTFSIG